MMKCAIQHIECGSVLNVELVLKMQMSDFNIRYAEWRNLNFFKNPMFNFNIDELLNYDLGF